MSDPLLSDIVVKNKMAEQPVTFLEHTYRTAVPDILPIAMNFQSKLYFLISVNFDILQ